MAFFGLLPDPKPAGPVLATKAKELRTTQAIEEAAQRTYVEAAARAFDNAQLADRQAAATEQAIELLDSVGLRL